MGVNGLWSLLKTAAPGSMRPLNPTELAGRIIAVDAPMLLTAALKACVNPGDCRIWEVDYVKSIINRVRRLLIHGATVHMILDGQAPACKAKTQEKRRAVRAAAEQKIESARANQDIVELERAVRAAAALTPHLINLAVDALNTLTGVSCTVASGEAEQMCADMTNDGRAWAVATEDGDALVFGARRLLRGVVSGRQFTDDHEECILLVDRDLMLDILEIGPSQLRWLATLAGTDYHPGLPNVGAVRALKLVRQSEFIDEGTSINCAQLTSSLHFTASQFGTWMRSEFAEVGLNVLQADQTDNGDDITDHCILVENALPVVTTEDIATHQPVEGQQTVYQPDIRTFFKPLRLSQDERPLKRACV